MNRAATKTKQCMDVATAKNPNMLSDQALQNNIIRLRLYNKQKKSDPAVHNGHGSMLGKRPMTRTGSELQKKGYEHGIFEVNRKSSTNMESNLVLREEEKKTITATKRTHYSYSCYKINKRSDLVLQDDLGIRSGATIFKGVP